MSPQRAVVLNGPRDIRVQQRPVWPPSHGQVQIRIISTGLCGSDLHYYLKARNGDFALKSPLVLGHESSGIVTAVGPGVDNVYVGQRVVVEPGIMCNACKYCDQGRYNLCPNLRFCSSAKTFPHTDGTLQEYMNHPAHVVHPIPDTLPLDIAALAEPLSVLLHASSRAGIQSQAPKSVLVFGVGTIGILACALSRSYGVKNICAVDIDNNRLNFARDGKWADSTYTLPLAGNAKPRTIEDSKRIITEALQHFKQTDGFDLVFECTGVESCIQMSVFAATPGSKVMLVGMGSPNVNLPLSAAALREVDLVGSFRYAGTWKQAVDLLDRTCRALSHPLSPSTPMSGFHNGGLGNIKSLITHRFPLSETKEAFELMARGKDSEGGLVLKVLIESED